MTTYLIKLQLFTYASHITNFSALSIVQVQLMACASLNFFCYDSESGFQSFSCQHRNAQGTIKSLAATYGKSELWLFCTGASNLRPLSEPSQTLSDSLQLAIEVLFGIAE